MALRIKKYLNPAGALDQIKKPANYDEINNKMNMNPILFSQSSPQVPGQLPPVATPQAAQQKPVGSRLNVAGYGDVNFDDAKLLEHIGKLSESDPRLRQYYSDALNYLKSGKITSIDEFGSGVGDFGKLYGKSKKFSWDPENDKSVLAQRAMGNLLSSIRDYTKTGATPTTEKGNYTLGLEDRVSKATNAGSKGKGLEYFNSLTHKDRRPFIESAFNNYFDEIQDKGEWNKDTHTGDEDIYKRLSGQREPFNADLKQLLDTSLADGNVTPDELAQFVNKWGVNPIDLLSKYSPTAEQKALTDAEKAEQDKKLKEEWENRIATESKNRGGLTYTGTHDEDSFNDIKNWRYHNAEDNTPFTGILSDNFDHLGANPYLANKFYKDGIGVPLELLEGEDDYALTDYMRKAGLYQDALSDLNNATRFRNEYASRMANLFTNPEYFVQGSEQNARSRDPLAAQVKIENYHKNKNISPEERAAGVVAKYQVQDLTSRRGYRTIYIDKDGKEIHASKIGAKKQSSALPAGIPTVEDVMNNTPQYTPSHKKGGSVNFKKINKYQFGGSQVAATGEQMNQMQQASNNRKADMANQLKRSATLDEVFGDDFQMTNADKADLAALGLDIAGIVAGFVPGGSTVTAATGLGSTLTSYGADIARNGIGWGNTGSALVSAGMDAASLIPGLGQYAKGVKIARGLQKTGKFLVPLMKAAGYTQAAAIIANSAMTGESLNLRDYQVLAGAFKGLQASGMKAFAKARGTTATGESTSTIKGVDGDIKVKGTKSDVKNAIDKNFVAGQQSVKGKQAQLKELRAKTSTVGEAELPAHQKAMSDLEASIKTETTALTDGLKAKGFGDDDIAKIMGADIQLNQKGIVNPVNGWDPRKWTMPVQGKQVKVEGGDAPNRVLKDGKLAWYDRYARGFARKQGYISKADYDKGNFNGHAGPIAAANDKVTSTTNSLNKTNSKIEANKGKINSNTEAIKGKQKDILANKAETDRLIAERATIKDKIKKAKGNKDLIDQLRSERGKINKMIRSLRGKPGTMGKQIDRLNSKNSKIEADNITLGDKAKATQTKLDKYNKALETRTNEFKSDYGSESMFSTVNNNNNMKTGIIAGAAAGTAMIGSIIGSVGSDSKKVSELKKLGRASLMSEKASIESILATNPKSKEYRRRLALINKALSETPSYKEGGSIPMHRDGAKYGTNATSNPISIKDSIKNFTSDLASPRNLKFANTLWTNAKLHDTIKQLPRPQSMVAPTTQKLKSYGATDAMNQYNQIGQNQNAAQYSSSDAKLNAVQRLAQNEQVMDAYNQVGDNLNRLNQQVDSQNSQLYSQDAATRAQVTAQNAAQNQQFQTMMNQYKQGLIRSNGQSIDQLLSERQYRDDAVKDQLMSLDMQSEQDRLNKLYSPKLNEIQSRYDNIAREKGLTLQEYLSSNLAEKLKYEKEMAVYQDARKSDYNDFYRKRLTSKMAKGGTIDDKKELMAYREEMKRIANRDKAFNKLVLDKMKSHEKVLSLLLKNK